MNTISGSVRSYLLDRLSRYRCRDASRSATRFVSCALGDPCRPAFRGHFCRLATTGIARMRDAYVGRATTDEAPRYNRSIARSERRGCDYNSMRRGGWRACCSKGEE